MNSTASSWVDAGSALPLRAWDHARQRFIADTLVQALRQWERDWGLAAREGDVSCATATEALAGAAVQALGERASAAACIELPVSFDAALAQALWGEACVYAPIARAVQLTCGADMLARLAAALGLDPAPRGASVPAIGVGAWTGSVCVLLPWALRLLLNGDAMQAAMPAHAPPGARALPAVPPLTKVKDALAGRRLPLRVHLADCDLTLGKLRDLQLGDVLALPHGIETPLHVRDAQGVPICHGALARKHASKAVHLIAATSGDGKAMS